MLPRQGIAFELESISVRWQGALDAADAALRAAAPTLPAAEIARRRRDLVLEHKQAADALARLAGTTGVRPAPWLSPVPVRRPMLGLPATVAGCLFDLDGVLSDSGLLHAQAWGEVFDAFLLRLSEKTGAHFIPFDRDGDYRKYVAGRPRLEGVHRFLDSRGIQLPEGKPDDPADTETASGLARQKHVALERTLRARGVAPLPGARRYLEAAGRAGIQRAVISASAHTTAMLELTKLATVVDGRIDADVIRTERLRSPPAPDMLLAACRRLGVEARAAVCLTHSPAGVEAALATGIPVIAVTQGTNTQLLEGAGAERVVTSLNDLLDPRLRSS